MLTVSRVSSRLNPFAPSRSGSLRSLPRIGLPLLCASVFLRCGAAQAPDGLAEPDEPMQQQAALATDTARTVRSLTISPTNPLIRVDLNRQANRTFRVIARYSDGTNADVTSKATFTVDNPAAGAMFGARFDSNIRTTPQVEFAQVTARYKEGSDDVSVSTNLTVAWLRTSGASKDLLFVLPYNGKTDSETLTFSSNIQSLDAFFAVDTTGSMGAPIRALRDSLQTTILPAVRAAAVRDAWIGVGAVEDFPTGSYGSPRCNGSMVDDNPFILLAPMTSDAMTAQSAVNQLLIGSSPRGCGADTPEGQMEALYQIATGAGNQVTDVVNVPPHKDKGRGGVEFRAGSLPVITMISDAVFHTKGEAGKSCYGSPVDYSGAAAMAAHSRSETTAALKSICARVVGVSVQSGASAECTATADLVQMAKDTGARVPPQAWDALGRPTGCAAGQCCTGVDGAGETPDADGLCALVFKSPSSGAGLGAQVAAGITQLVRYAAFDVGTSKDGQGKGEDGTALPAGKTTADFLLPVKPVDATLPTLPPGLKPPTISGERFLGVTPGTTLRFTIEAKNTFAPATTKPQLFRAKLVVQASGCADLDERDVLIIVPAA